MSQPKTRISSILSRKLSFLLAILCLLLLVFFWLRLRVVDTHNEMLSLLEEIRARTPIENRFLGTADLLKLNHQVEAASTLPELISGLWERAPVELRLGMNDESLADLKKIQELMSNLKRTLQPKEYQEFEAELYFQLAVASMRKGETENCVDCQAGESCILPIKGEGVHKQKNFSLILRNSHRMFLFRTSQTLQLQLASTRLA